LKRSLAEAPVVTPLSLIVVIFAGEILMVLDRQRGQWELPGGIRERGESARQAAGPELAEETGMSAADLASLRRDGRIFPDSARTPGVRGRVPDNAAGGAAASRQ
jgi:ADP-ribose pyrophosphatase YjhB (NUDIX family)